MALLFHSTPERGAVWRRIFAEAGEEFFGSEAEVNDPAAVTQIACWRPPTDLTRYANLRTFICVGAGTDHLTDLPKGVALVRTDVAGIAEMVRDWAVMAALALHRGLPVCLDQASRGEWKSLPARPARTCRVGVMGMGRIGKLAASSLAELGFDVAGYSRSGQPIEGVRIYGAAERNDFLARTDLVICLLPLTDSTRGLLNDDLFARLPRGAQLVHAGRGPQLDMNALRRALNDGHLHAAMLDVTEPEPLPADHWAWTDHRIIVTPHIAAHTDPEEGARFALRVMEAQRAGAPLPGLVDPARGY